jgi:hypothetical protein
VIDTLSTSFDGRGGSNPPRKRGPDRRYALVVGIALILGLGAGILVLSPDFAGWRHSASPPGAKRGDTEVRTGNIVFTANGGCRQSSFDNDTGRVSQAGKPCENGEFSNDKGDQKAKGLERRLGAISKSFSK